MKEDIPFLPVEGVSVAVVRKPVEVEEEAYDWQVHLINENKVPIQNAMIVSKGYGTIDGESKKTSILRHMITEIPPNSAALIEPIDPAVFSLTNQYWVSYYIGKQVYDKKFIFVPETIIPDNLSHIPQLDMEGVLHR